MFYAFFPLVITFSLILNEKLVSSNREIIVDHNLLQDIKYSNEIDDLSSMYATNHLIQSDAPKTDVLYTPPEPKIVQTGEILTLRCPLFTSYEINQRPVTDVSWTKNGIILPHIYKAELVIPFATQNDSGMYDCRRSLANSISIGRVNLTVLQVESNGCADGTSEGFHDAHNVRGCAGVWQGHIKKAGKQLCGRGWRVCAVKDLPFLQQIDESYNRDFSGCFAYNAAQVRFDCKPCKKRFSMAALGSSCPVNIRLNQMRHKPRKSNRRHDDVAQTCNKDRIIQAYSDKDMFLNGIRSGCRYQRGSAVTGVLCCRKENNLGRSEVARQKLLNGYMQDQPAYDSYNVGQADDHELEFDRGSDCDPPCQNGGTCKADGRCICPTAFWGQNCQRGGCLSRCLNGGTCHLGTCLCRNPFRGHNCSGFFREPISIKYT